MSDINAGETRGSTENKVYRIKATNQLPQQPVSRLRRLLRFFKNAT